MPRTSDGFTMRSYSEAFELAMMCARNARFSSNKEWHASFGKWHRNTKPRLPNSIMAGSLISATHLGG